jgi:hypothetical protein
LNQSFYFVTKVSSFDLVLSQLKYLVERYLTPSSRSTRQNQLEIHSKIKKGTPENKKDPTLL